MYCVLHIELTYSDRCLLKHIVSSVVGKWHLLVFKPTESSMIVSYKEMHVVSFLREFEKHALCL